ncbi:PHD domain-containing protein, partial [Aphis craccivora]
LKIGSEFSSFNELENSLISYEAKHFCDFTKSNSRTIGGTKKGLKRYINPQLKYAEIDYVCVNGGEYKNQSKGTS